MGTCIVRYRGCIYDQQDATNSQYLLLEMLYMFRAIIAHHQELGTVCTPYGCTYSSELLMMDNDDPKHVEHFQQL
jgi:hypothetical protein